jgi:hypothetical protein
MKTIDNMTKTKKIHQRDGSTRGVALIYTMLILTLLTVLSLGMVIALSSQTFIGGYYRNFRGAFYAADSGINIARQAMVNKALTLVPATITIGSQPLPAGSDATVQTFVNTTYNAWGSIAAGQAANSWPGQFELNSSVPATFAYANCHLSYSPVGAPPAGGPYTCTALPPAASTCSTAAGILTNCYTINNFQYTYNYSVDVFGQVKGNEQSELADNGNIQITVNISPPTGTTTNQSFAAWGMFINTYAICDGSTLVPGTISGPVFTNGAWNFGTAGKYIFTDAVGSANANAGYQFGGGCNQVAGPSDASGGVTIAPTFQNGFNLGQPPVPLPTDSYSQKWAAIDGKGVGEHGVVPPDTPPAPNDSDLHSNNMTTAAGVVWPSAGGIASGVYMPYVAGGVGTCPGPATHHCITGGGVYVKGNAAVTMSAVIPNSGPYNGDKQQVFTIVQSGVTSTVTVDLTANTTIFTTGGNTVTMTGVPQNLNANPPTEAAMVFVDGSITSLAGSGSASVQDGSAVTVTAASDITVTGNITYKTEPVTTTQNQIVAGTTPACCNGTPADTLIPYTTPDNSVLGIFTAGGNINMNVAGGSNLEIDASVATIVAGGSGGLQNTGGAINTLNIVGGRIQNDILNINTTTRNVFFDRRFANGNFAPPWFPSTAVTSVPSGVEASTASNPVVTRVQWVCKSCN